MNHFDDTDTSAKVAGEFFGDFASQLEDFEALLGADREVRLVLVEGDVQNLLFVLLHIASIKLLKKQICSLHL